MPAQNKNKQVKITLKRSLIGSSDTQRKVVTGLGLRKLNHSVTHYDSPTIRGMINKVPHLLAVEEV
jgi:large subunit ribosomal protein L30